MFQTVTSHVLRVQLGGKSYAPDANCPLRQYHKGLDTFVTIMQKLQTFVEEYSVRYLYFIEEQFYFKQVDFKYVQTLLYIYD